jgi:hypothetical protein
VVWLPEQEPPEQVSDSVHEFPSSQATLLFG